jgi:RNase P subunit RPR2
MSAYDIKRREAQRAAFCRGCDNVIARGEHMISTYSFRNTGQHIHFCLECAVKIGELAKPQEGST